MMRARDVIYCAGPYTARVPQFPWSFTGRAPKETVMIHRGDEDEGVVGTIDACDLRVGRPQKYLAHAVSPLGRWRLPALFASLDEAKAALLSHLGTEWNVMEALRQGHMVRDLGMVPLVPHAAVLLGASYEEAMAECFELLARADGLLCLDRWHLSPGSIREVEHARELNIPVYKSLAELRALVAQEGSHGS